MHVECTKSIPIRRTPRVMQLEGLFDLPAGPTATVRWSADLPLEQRAWNIGLIVGPSGCGKTTLLETLFPESIRCDLDWPADRSLVDAFPPAMGIKEITRLLSSVGMSSVPSWLRPYRVLSNGEQFRAAIARALAEAIKQRIDLRDTNENTAPAPVVIDEFTSVVDRTVARIGSAAVARTVRRCGLKFVAASCHDDIIDWLDPDWIYEPALDAFQWRCERRGSACESRRPPIEIIIVRANRRAWRLFRPHHYLSGSLHPAARCFVGSVEGRPAAFTAVLPFPHPQRPGWREHRTVCLPDFQGVGIGCAVSDFVASLFKATGKPYFSTTSNPALIHRRAASSCWTLHRAPSRSRRTRQGTRETVRLSKRCSHQRLAAGFEYTGPARVSEARAFGVLP